MEIFTHLNHYINKNKYQIDKLTTYAKAEPSKVLKILNSRIEGLHQHEISSRLKKCGLNEIAREKKKSFLVHFWNNIKNPLVILLLVLGFVSFITGDIRSTILILIMVLLSLVLRFIQEMRADRSAEKLKAMVRNTATVLRNNESLEIDLKMLVPGDIVLLSAGDMIPADIRILNAKDLFLNQAALTGESLPIEKNSLPVTLPSETPFEISNLCFLGSNVVSGSGLGVVFATGNKTYFGSLAEEVVQERQLTSFDKGVNKFTWLMIKFIIIMVPAVFLINVFTKHDWFEAFLFALAVGVGLTPEMLPMIVTVNLSKGALDMAKKKTIIKRLNAIQNFGAMNILCTDKTGTITEGRIVLERHVNVLGEPSEEVLHYGYLNSYYHTGLKNLLDDSILDHEDLEERLKTKAKYHKIDEIPFDFERRRMSVVVEENDTGMHKLICKGAINEVLQQCSKIEINGVITEMSSDHINKCKKNSDDLNSQGFRVIAIAYKSMPGSPEEPVYSIKDEENLVMMGFLSFLDPPKETTYETLQRLKVLNVDVKILTGDNEVVTSYICKKVGIPIENLLQGPQIEKMTDDELKKVVQKTSVFARLVPMHKERIIKALQSCENVIGFMGDGINDAPALKTADVSISVDSAVDIAKESSDIILLENSLLVLEQGVLDGRKVFGNIMKYIRMAASSNFGNMFSVIGASAFLPFLPMLPIQVLTNNLLYDFSQTTIPTDKVDEDWLKKPRKWVIGDIKRFILFIGPISSIFDYVTFFVMLYMFNCWQNPDLFHTGWFVESIVSQTLIIHVIRTQKIPFLQSWASWPLIISSIIIVGIGVWLTFSPLSSVLGFVTLPSLYWIFLVVIVLLYITLTQIVKSWFLRRFAM